MSIDNHFKLDKFQAIYGHSQIIRLLQNAISGLSSRGRGEPETNGMMGPHHAYLLLGPNQVGKSTVIRTFARALLCKQAQDHSGIQCQCRSCQLMDSGNHPDFRLIQPLDREGRVDRAKGILRKDQVEQLIRDALLHPVEGNFKIFLIQDMHTANDTFSNKLLKTLEEPPDSVIICLTAPDRDSVLPTIVSRCQILELRPLSTESIEQTLIERWGAETDQARLVARLSGGRLGWAVTQIDNPKLWQKRQEQLQELWQLSHSDRIQRLKFAEQLAANRNSQRIVELLELWTSWWRDVMLVQSGCTHACCNIDHQPEMLRQAGQLPSHIVQNYLHTLKRIEGYLQHTTNTRMALDVLVLQMPKLASI